MHLALTMFVNVGHCTLHGINILVIQKLGRLIREIISNNPIQVLQACGFRFIAMRLNFMDVVNIWMP